MRRFSWLCRATSITWNQITGPLIFLQVCATRRVYIIALFLGVAVMPCIIWIVYRPGLGSVSTWPDLMDWRRREVMEQKAQTYLPILWHASGITQLVAPEPVACVTFHGDELDKMRYKQFIWLPYSEKILRDYPNVLQESELWRHIVDQFRSGRVGSTWPSHATLRDVAEHAIAIGYKSNVARLWLTGSRHNGLNVTHQSIMALWEQRYRYIVLGKPSLDSLAEDNSYMLW